MRCEALICLPRSTQNASLRWLSISAKEIRRSRFKYWRHPGKLLILLFKRNEHQILHLPPTYLHDSCFLSSHGVFCPVRAKITSDGMIVNLDGVHNHLPKYGKQARAVRAARTSWLKAGQQNKQLHPMAAVLEARRW